MTKPVFYIAEAPTFSAGEIMIALMILVAALALLGAVLIVGVRGFYRIGRGRWDSLAAKVSPAIGLFDVLLFLAAYDESLFYAAAPAVAHAVAFSLGVASTRGESPQPSPPEG